MKYKPNWPETKERLTALWHHKPMDRPCIAVMAPNGKQWPGPILRKVEDKWLDPDFIVRRAIATFETTYYGGEAFPSTLIMAGWVVNTYGATPHFPMDTIWFEPLNVDWDNPPSLDLDWESPWFRKVLALHQAVLAEAGKDRFLVGQGCFMAASDMLAFVLGTENVLVAMAERPEWTRNAILKLTQNWIALHRYFFRLAAATHEFWYGNPGWMPFWAPELYVSTQSDISCMLSPAMYDEFIVPELNLIGQEFKHVWYHLDGQSAWQHVDRLLSLPYVKVVQFTPMSGSEPNGPAYLSLYKRIQAAGKIVHIQLPAENVEPLVMALDPALLCLDTHCANVREADNLLAAVCRRTK
ncbi:MAG: hypothetical protein KKG09_10145 [Verrucomicrobia bacterium]|nr:hypothetical protein [Verrucomicrobiota bacterium]MBU4291061.1 hypothetical protein [Verrucomicrobiota bacterium]MBU4427845.1 hypothetical protein [Verrucomicrobiota bacterium]MBU4498352.1 hypothetical protein [Verrucomicrobiota bacterium]MCG2679457.1 hypothetical protein [Kiritimatiellia bacterium]